jgi:hypothetical protein
MAIKTIVHMFVNRLTSLLAYKLDLYWAKWNKNNFTSLNAILTKLLILQDIVSNCLVFFKKTD